MEVRNAIRSFIVSIAVFMGKLYTKTTRLLHNLQEILWQFVFKINKWSMKAVKRVLKPVLVIFTIYVCFLFVTFGFAPIFWPSVITKLQDPPKTVITWENGLQQWEKWNDSCFGVKLFLLSVDVTEDPIYRFQYILKVPRIVNDTIIYYQELVETVELRYGIENSTRTYSLRNWNGDVSLRAFGNVDRFPWDVHAITFTCNGLEDIDITEDGKIFAGCSSASNGWSIFASQGEFNPDDDEQQFSVTFTFKRRFSAIGSELLIPLIVLGAIVATYGVTGSLSEYNDEDGEKDSQDSDREEKICDNNWKFRVETSRWILVFGFANLFFAGSKISRITAFSSIAVVSFILSVSYHFSSNYQEDDSYLRNLNFLSVFLAFIIGILLSVLLIVSLIEFVLPVLV